MKKIILLSAIAIVALSGTAAAYTGPGLGMATIAVVIGFFTSIFIALFAVIWYPIKRLLKTRKKLGITTQTSSNEEEPRQEDAPVEPNK